MRAALVIRLARRDWRSGELGLLLAALLVAVGTVTAISLFVDRLQQALLLESANFLAADRYIGSSMPIPQAFRDEARALGLEMTDTMVFPSMVFAGESRNDLVSVKAVAPGYPLRGTVRSSMVPFSRGEVTTDIPAPGEVWLDSRLFPSLSIALGQQIEVGMARLRVTRVVTSEPDRGGSFFDLGPRLMMNIADVPATEVVQPGSRIGYRLLLRGDADSLEALQEDLPLKPNFSWVGVKDSSPRIGSALDRAESFLLLGGLLGVLLAGVAVALSAHRYAQRHYDHVGILKTLGATPNQVLGGYVSILLLIGSIAVTLGLVLGVLLHLGIVALLSSLIPIELPAPGSRPFLLGITTGLICALAFAMPPLLHLKNVSPMRVIRRDLGVAPVSQWLSYGAAAAGSLLLLVWYTESIFLTLWTLLGALVVLFSFGGMAMLLLRGGRVVGMQAGSGWRLALSALRRRHRENTAQILIFGLAIMLLLVLTLLRTSLLEEWRSQMPVDVPNHFLMNVLPDQVDDVREMLATNTERQGILFPMISGRIVSGNGLDGDLYQKELRTEQGPGPRLRSERNLTWSADVPQDNKVVTGSWWSVEDGRSLVSLEVDYARDLGLQIGDVLGFNIGGRVVEATVANTRRLDWESLQPNFFIVFSPSALQGLASTYMTSFYLPAERKQFLNTFLSRFPTVTVIEVDAIIAQISSIIDRVTQAVELVLGLVVISGCLVLVASIQASRDTRMAEHALIRTLGGTRKLITSSLAAEFAVLGMFSGIVAVVGAEVTVALLQTQVFDLSADIHPWLWLLGPLVGATLVLTVGLFTTRRLVSTPPILVLRGVT
ncbi:MAG: FtsX-like permease family protein [Proteobacteria bacterium]|nr:FtsX-like permease family protein [Pseudomonadota bacterium]